jgi:hypothetical protein
VHRIKLFKGVESEIAELEHEINQWLAASEARIVQVFGNIAPQTIGSGKTGSATRIFDQSDVLIAVVYDA